MTVPARSTILVVDDDPDIVSFIHEALEQHGFNVVTALSGFDALAACSRQPFDLVITDLAMPGMHGFELMDEINNRYTMLPIIVLTGFDTRDMMREAMKRGAYDFLAKPIILDELLVTVRNALDNYRAIVERQRALSDLERLRTLMTEAGEKPPGEPLPLLARGWKPEEFNIFRALGKETDLAVGEEVSWEHPATDGIVFILQGAVRIARGPTFLVTLPAGDAWGASALLNAQPRPVRLVAETNAVILRIGLNDALAFFRQREERLFKIWAINLIHQQALWLDTAWDRIAQSVNAIP